MLAKIQRIWGLASKPCAGGQDGKVRVYDLNLGEQVHEFTAAADTVNGLQFHPFLPLAATASGATLNNFEAPESCTICKQTLLLVFLPSSYIEEEEEHAPD